MWESYVNCGRTECPRNQITWMPGASQATHRPKFAFVDLRFSIINVSRIRSSKLLTIVCSFPIFTSTRNIVALSTTSISLHQPSGSKSLRSSPMMLCNRRNQCRGYEERKEKRFRTFTATQHQTERTAAR